ncbi:MAG TPA: metal-dependent transcriptional regulator [Bacilli bacterium]|jgi:DtxR family Mn-dependent transcriptional regulator|nr:metal-dependent transcriptional regulator [Acholeplasmataceae bacterium]OQB61644.1 MAG: Transcriptional regulator MntR [Tenericutes bacterium ADurb.Bin140]HOE77989.1 metal-dependent transcriptional regulator [Bacilli bacterium]HON64389.1 metal-dependent transcriptional regulator [Bacilli bacterium]HOR95804.1 metal-dependent transcriptional regulator [Bacilli bacterium]
MKILTKSNEDYLEAIVILSQKDPKVKSVEVARLLGVSKPAVNKAMNELKENLLIEKDNYGDIELTDRGRTLGNQVYQKHLLIRSFLLKIGVSEEIADTDCCLIEHVISEETYNALVKLMKEVLDK